MPRGDERDAPDPLHGEAAAFDRSTDRMVLFGGSTPSRATLAGTWAWDGRWWLAADSASGPSARAGAAIEYDPTLRAIVMLGGFRIDAPRGSDPQLCDAWLFRGGRWLGMGDGPCVTTRLRSWSLVYSSRAKATLLVDGPALPGDTALRPLRIWKWADRRWQLVDSTGPRRSGFSRVAFDDARGVLVVPVLFGGPDEGVWEWNGQWRRIEATGPSRRQTYGLVYDSRAQRVVLGGGQGGSRGPYHDDFWSWDGRVWTQWPAYAGGPVGRGGGNLLFDHDQNRFIYFGGYDSGPLRDLWVFSDGRWKRMDRES